MTGFAGKAPGLSLHFFVHYFLRFLKLHLAK